MPIDEVLSLTFAEFNAYISNIAPLISHAAAVSMPWDAMVEKKHRPRNVPDFFKVETVASSLSPEELIRFTKTGQV